MKKDHALPDVFAVVSECCGEQITLDRFRRWAWWLTDKNGFPVSYSSKAQTVESENITSGKEAQRLWQENPYHSRWSYGLFLEYRVGYIVSTGSGFGRRKFGVVSGVVSDGEGKKAIITWLKECNWVKESEHFKDLFSDLHETESVSIGELMQMALVRPCFGDYENGFPHIGRDKACILNATEYPNIEWSY